MSKSHFFVQRPPKDQLSQEDGAIECGYCHRMFIPKGNRRKYCSEECYRESMKAFKAQWFQEHKRELHERRQNRLHESGKQLPMDEYYRLVRARKRRNRVIKQELIYLELMTFQIRNIHKEIKINYKKGRKHVNEAKVELVKNELHKLGLYKEEILQSEKYHLDFDDEYKRRTV